MRILVVGPDPEALVEALRRREHEVEMEVTAEGALRRLDAPEAPRIVLWQASTSGLSPSEASGAIAAQGAERPLHLLVATERYREREALEALEHGADDVLLLPLDELELELRIWAGRRRLSLREQLSAAVERARTDPETGLWGRESILELLERELSRADRQGGWVGVLALEVARPEGVAGELLVRLPAEVASRLLTSVRTSDWVGRLTRDRYCVVLANCNEERTRHTAERIRRRLEGPGLPGGGVETIPVRLGTAAGKGSESDRDALLDAALGALRR